MLFRKRSKEIVFPNTLGVNIMMAIFFDFRYFSSKKLAFFLKTIDMFNFFRKINRVLNKNTIFCQF
jgi:hypothetical protein